MADHKQFMVFGYYAGIGKQYDPAVSYIVRERRHPGCVSSRERDHGWADRRCSIVDKGTDFNYLDHKFRDCLLEWNLDCVYWSVLVKRK